MAWQWRQGYSGYCYTYNHSLVLTQQWACFNLSLMITQDPLFHICSSKLDVMSTGDLLVCPVTIQVVRTSLWKACLSILSSPSWSGVLSRMAPSGSTGRPCTSSARSSARSFHRMSSTSSARSIFSVQFSQTTYRYENIASHLLVLSRNTEMHFSVVNILLVLSWLVGNYFLKL